MYTVKFSWIGADGVPRLSFSKCESLEEAMVMRRMQHQGIFYSGGYKQVCIIFAPGFDMMLDKDYVEMIERGKELAKLYKAIEEGTYKGDDLPF